MFNKLLSNLPYNPSAIEDLSFYMRRLKKEKSVRRVGFVLVAMSMLVQIIAASVPPQKSMAASSNDIIRGGVNSRSDILSAWDRSGSDLPAIYGKFGVTRADIASLPSKPNVTIRSNAHDFWSIGRNSLSGYSGISEGYKDSEVRLRSGGSTFYMRKLNAWGVASYPAFKGRVQSTGKQFWIIADCGNFTQLGKETPAKPKLEVHKSLVGGKWTVAPGETISYRVQYRNAQDDSLAENVELKDDIDAGYIEKLSPNIPMTGAGIMVKKVGNLASSDNSRIFDLTVRVKPNIANGTKICNIATLSASNATSDTSGKICVTVVTPNTPPPPPPPTCPDGSPMPPSKICHTDPPPPGSTKTVTNVTQNLSGNQALQSVVHGGDVIEYNLVTSNNSSTPMKGHEIADYVGDVLEYADLDTAFLASQGGTYNPTTNQVIWSNQTIPANGQLDKKFRVTMKNPIPGTNSPTPASTSFDCKISNKYGDELSLNVECPMMKTVEELPNTGPGTTIGIAFTVTTISGYFLARSSLLSKELGIVKKEYTTAGV